MKFKKSLCLLTCIFSMIHGYADDCIQEKDVLFYESFDNTLEPVIAKGSAFTTGSHEKYTEGMAGNAVNPGQKEIRFIQLGNLSRTQGTVFFWMKPGLSFTDAKSATVTLFRGPGFRLTYVKENNMLFFMSGRLFEKNGFQWDYSCCTNEISKWKKDEWHSVAISWNSEHGIKKIFIDGKIVASASSKIISSDNDTAGASIAIGTENFPCEIDEFIITQNELSDSEIAFLNAKPQETSAMLHALRKAIPVEKAGSPLHFPIKKYVEPEASILKPGDIFKSEFTLQNIGKIPFDDNISFELTDFHDNVRDHKDIRVKLSSGETAKLEIDFKTPDEKGVFKISAKFSQNGKAYIKDINSCATWPEIKRDPVQDSFFGNHVNSWDNGKFIRQAARLGQSWQRVHDMLQCTWWNRVQAEPGALKWSLDNAYNEYKKRNIPVLGCLTGTPYWALKNKKTNDKGGARGFPNPPNQELWKNYVAETVRHYKDYIRYWEIYNEPAVSGFWNGTPKELAELNKIAYETIKSIDPSAYVMTAGYTYPSWKWHEEHAKAGALKYVDIISVHIFPGFEFGKDIEEAEFKLKENLKHFRSLSEKYAGKELSIWSTESAVGDSTWFRGLDFPELPPEDKRPPLNAKEGAYRVVLGSALLQAEGVKKHFYYWQGPLPHGEYSYENTSMLDVNDAPRPKLIARIAMAELLDDCEYKCQIRRPDDGRFLAMIYEKKDGSSSVVLWACGNGGKISADVKWPGNPKYIDIMGNRTDKSNPVVLTEEPSYVVIQAPVADVKKAVADAKITIITQPGKLKLQEETDKPEMPYLPDYVVPSENPAGIFSVDLRKYCNMGFADEKPGDGKGGWADEGAMNDMAEFPVGKQTFYSVPFDIIHPADNDGKSIITLSSRGITPSFPQKVTIPVNVKNVVCLYFLHSAAWGTKGKIGKYVINYSDGSKEEIVNEIPVSNGNWWHGYSENESSKPVPVKVTNTASGKPSWRYVRVFEWANPEKKKEISSIEFISDNGIQVPILLAITGVKL